MSVKRVKIGKEKTGEQIEHCGYGGHFRAVQGFKYIGDEN